MQQVGWNFEKFLIGRDGKVVGPVQVGRRAGRRRDFVKAIKTELDKPAPAK